MDTRRSNEPQPEYGAPPEGAYYPPQPPAPKKSHKAQWIVAAVIATVVIVGVISNSGHKNDTGPGVGAANPAQSVPAENSAIRDVTLDKFTVDSIGSVTEPMTVVNHSSKTSNYIIEFEVLNAAGTKIGDGIASTNNLAPGQTAEISGIALSVGAYPTRVHLTQVTRYAS